MYGSSVSHLILKDQGSRDYGYREGETDEGGRESELERTLVMVASGVVDSHDSLAHVSMEKIIFLLSSNGNTTKFRNYVFSVF